MALWIADVNFVLQFVILGVLSVGLFYKQRGKFVFHGSTMLIAVVLNAVSFFLVMWPSFVAFDFTVLDSPLKVVSLTHGILGGIAEILGLFLVVAWGVQKKMQSCIRRKIVMRITILLWLIALVLGILLYAGLYGIITI
ncbi:hypothetical protein HXY33_04235 [Candidatus Bathyarchaeota archaeon]|nr:hypothetical protein [Candidatus Bathyarchaeota archaeon]